MNKYQSCLTLLPILLSTAGAYAECDTSQHAKYATDTQILTIPFLDIEMIDPITQQPTGEMAVAHVDLSLKEGADDFVIIPDTLNVIEIAPEASECNALYTYKGGTLHIPNLDVEEIIVLPPGIVAGSVTRTYEATLRQLPLTPEIFHLEEYTRVGTGDGDTGGGEEDDIDPPAAECSLEDQAQLMEPFALYNAVMPMVVSEHMINGEWPIPLSSAITPPTGVYTANLETHDPFHIDAIMKTEAEGVASCFAGKTIHFIYNPTTGTFGCNTDIPAEYMTLFPMTCN